MRLLGGVAGGVAGGGPILQAMLDILRDINQTLKARPLEVSPAQRQALLPTSGLSKSAFDQIQFTRTSAIMPGRPAADYTAPAHLPGLPPRFGINGEPAQFSERLLQSPIFSAYTQPEFRFRPSKASPSPGQIEYQQVNLPGFCMGGGAGG